jgi:hypothetical protein
MKILPRMEMVVMVMLISIPTKTMQPNSHNEVPRLPLTPREG